MGEVPLQAYADDSVVALNIAVGFGAFFVTEAPVGFNVKWYRGKHGGSSDMSKERRSFEKCPAVPP
jgi:hypothetical protein